MEFDEKHGISTKASAVAASAKAKVSLKRVMLYSSLCTTAILSSLGR